MIQYLQMISCACRVNILCIFIKEVIWSYNNVIYVNRINVQSTVFDMAVKVLLGEFLAFTMIATQLSHRPPATWPIKKQFKWRRAYRGWCGSSEEYPAGKHSNYLIIRKNQVWRSRKYNQKKRKRRKRRRRRRGVWIHTGNWIANYPPGTHRGYKY